MVDLEDDRVLAVLVKTSLELTVRFEDECVRLPRTASGAKILRNQEQLSTRVPLEDYALIDVPEHEQEPDVLALSELAINESACRSRVMKLFMDCHRFILQVRREGFREVDMALRPELFIVTS